MVKTFIDGYCQLISYLIAAALALVVRLADFSRRCGGFA